MIQSKREEVIKQFSSAPVKKPVVPLGKGKKKVVEEKPAPMVMLLSLKVRRRSLFLYRDKGLTRDYPFAGWSSRTQPDRRKSGLPHGSVRRLFLPSLRSNQLTSFFLRWWQAAIEHQAIDRVNRIGQTKECVPPLPSPSPAVLTLYPLTASASSSLSPTTRSSLAS